MLGSYFQAFLINHEGGNMPLKKSLSSYIHLTPGAGALRKTPNIVKLVIKSWVGNAAYIRTCTLNWGMINCMQKEEFAEVRRKMKKEKALQSDEVLVEALKSLGGEAIKYLTSMSVSLL